MKARNITIVLIGILFCMVTDANAQARFYDTNRTFHEQGFTYVMHGYGGMVHLSNQNSRWRGFAQVNRDGTPRQFGEGPANDENNRTQMRQLAQTILDNAFSPAERQRLRGSSLRVSMWADSQTGVITDVEFSFVRTGGFATIPVTTYRRIELELKNRIRLAPTAVGRRRNFIMLNFEYEVR